MNLDNIDLLSLQTAFLRQDKFVQALCKAINPYFQKLSEDTKLGYIYGRIDELDEKVVDSLAWQFHVDFYDYTLPLDKKRELVKKSKKLHEIKGTPVAVEEAVTTIFGRTELKEWFEYDGDPYRFSLDIDITDTGASPEELIKLDRLIEAYKNKRSWLDIINIFFTTIGDLKIGAITIDSEEVVVYPWTPDKIQSTIDITIPIAQISGYEEVITYPKEG